MTLRQASAQMPKQHERLADLLIERLLVLSYADSGGYGWAVSELFGNDCLRASELIC